MNELYEKLRNFHKERNSYDDGYEENIIWYGELLSCVPEERRELAESFLQEVSVEHVDVCFLFLDVVCNL
ncbi:hypothetical protein D3C71_618000 [compost metagenome]